MRVPLSRAKELAPFVVLKLVAVVALGSDLVSNEAGALKGSVGNFQDVSVDVVLEDG